MPSTRLIDGNLQFQYLPEYAAFLLKNKIDDFVREQIRISRELQIPLLQFFDKYKDEQLTEIGRTTVMELLTSLADNEISAYISKATASYINNVIPFFGRESIVAEDISSVSLMRKKTFRIFLSEYTSDISLFAAILDELDEFIAASEASSFNAYIQIQQDKISQINKELALSQQELFEAEELAGMGSFLWDIKGEASRHTPGLVRIFDIKERSDLEGFLKYVHVDDRQKLSEAIEHSLKTDGVFDCEYRFIKNDREKWIWSRGIVSFAEGEPVSLKGTAMDVTGKYQLLEQLKKSEELNKQAQALTHIGNWAWEVSTNEIQWSDEVFRIYGLEPQSEKMTFDRIASFIHPEDKERVMGNTVESLSSHEINDYLMRIIATDGTVKALRIRGEVITCQNKQPQRLIGTVQDVTTEYNLNKELSEKEEYLKNLIDYAPDAVIVIDEKSVITLWNPKTETIFGWKAEEVLGKYIYDIIIPEKYREDHINGMKRLTETGASHILYKTLELTAINKKGEEFYISLTVSQLDQQKRKHFIAFIRDITNEKETKAELKAKTAQLEHLNVSLRDKNTELKRINKELESFNFVVSHDLQEPLRKIQVFADRVLEMEADRFTPRTADYLSRIISSSERMKQLIEDLLAFSQTTSNKDRFEKVDLNVILDEVKNILSTSIEKSRATIISDDLPTIRGVRFQIHQLLQNLVSNSIKYSRQDTPPEINISCHEAAGKDIALKDIVHDQTYYLLKLTDNGIGFHPDNSDRIFELFQRLHNKDSYTGTGIGLAICKKIVDNHGGLIQAEGFPSRGAVFTVCLPKVMEPVGQPEG